MLTSRIKTVQHVVPHAGTWIEMPIIPFEWNRLTVVPHAGTWIEIGVVNHNYPLNKVVPHAGTWIEIFALANISLITASRSPRGNVD